MMHAGFMFCLVLTARTIPRHLGQGPPPGNLDRQAASGALSRMSSGEPEIWGRAGGGGALGYSDGSDYGYGALCKHVNTSCLVCL